jgi:hypothetical protein
MFPHLNHPNFGWAVSAEDLMLVDRERFFEVYNGHPSVHNEGDGLHAGTERIWDIILTKRLAELGKEVMYGIGTDDAHNYHTNAPKASRPGQGWVMVQSEKLEPESLVKAMEAGHFYASSGVTLNAVASTSDHLSVEITSEPDVTYTTEFIGTRRGYNPVGQTITDASGNSLRVTRKYGPEVGQVLATGSGTTAIYRFTGDEIYVRARVTSTKAKSDSLLEGEMERAWTHPVVLRPKS